MKNTPVTLLIFALSLALPFIASGEDTHNDSLGLFDNWTDIGETGATGGAFYQASEQAYYLRAAGDNIWGEKDSFGFLWKHIQGDVIMESLVTIVHLSEAPHRKAGFMIRTSLEPDAPHVTCAVHGDGLVALQYRPSSGAATIGMPFKLKGAETIRLEKTGNIFTMSASKTGARIETKSVELEGFDGALLAGPWVCSKTVGQLEAARFGKLRFTQP
jgi:hypothetical protein